MVHILVIGASGYIGLNTAVELRNRGHRVWGTVRKEADAKTLLLKEITPVIAEISDAKTVPDDLLDQVSVVIDTVPDTPANRLLHKAVSAASDRAVAAGGSKKRYIYISGVLVYGDYKGQVVDETMPLKTTSPMGINRVKWEQDIVKSQSVDAVVARPGWVYGGPDGRYCGAYWKGNDKGQIEVRGNPKKYWSWVHIQDLARALAVLAEAPAKSVSGEKFDIADTTRLNQEELAVLLARTNGVKGPVVHIPAGEDPWSKLAESDALVAATKIRELGWQPRHGPLQDEVLQWHAATKAAGVI